MYGPTYVSGLTSNLSNLSERNLIDNGCDTSDIQRNSLHSDQSLSFTYPCSTSQHYQNDNTTASTKPTYFNFVKKGLHAASLNIQHIMPKMDELRIILNEVSSLDVFGLSETFLSENIQNKDLCIKGYNCERLDRKSKRGGGLLIYIKNNLSYTRCLDMESEIESIWLKLNLNFRKPVLLNYVYRPPNSPQSWIDDYEKQLTLAESSNYDWYALGDYNIIFTPPNNYNNTKWRNTVSDFGLCQLVTTPTRVTNTSSTIIDHIYTSSACYVTEIVVPTLSVSDHYPVAFTVSGNHFLLIQNVTK